MNITIAMPTFGIVTTLYGLSAMLLTVGYLSAKGSVKTQQRNINNGIALYHNGSNSLVVFWSALSVVATMGTVLTFIAATITMIVLNAPK